MTDKLKQAAQQALEAWDTRAGIDTASKAFGALRAALAQQPAEQEPVAWCHLQYNEDGTYFADCLQHYPDSYGNTPLYAAPQPAKREPLTPRELELIDGMIEVQLNHAERCDAIANRRIAAKQKEWDMERVELLRKIRAHGIGGGV